MTAIWQYRRRTQSKKPFMKRSNIQECRRALEVRGEWSLGIKLNCTGGLDMTNRERI